jgi:hypothetical protein
MYPKYDQSKGLFIIEWYEEKEKKPWKVKKPSSIIHHYFEQRPKKLQLHPQDPIIVRVHLSGKMPGWIENYCNSNYKYHFKCEEIEFEGEVGWMLTNWHHYPTGLQPILAPDLLGALIRFIDLIPDVCQDLKHQMIQNFGNAYRNLRDYSELFENLGVYYRPEEMIGVEGCLVVDHSCFLNRSPEMSDEEYRTKLEHDGRLFNIVKELTYPFSESTTGIPGSGVTNPVEGDNDEPDQFPQRNHVLEDETKGNVDLDSDPLVEIVPDDEREDEVDLDDEPLVELLPDDGQEVEDEVDNEPITEIVPDDDHEDGLDDEPLVELLPDDGQDVPDDEHEYEEHLNEEPAAELSVDETQGEDVDPNNITNEKHVTENDFNDEGNDMQPQYVVLDYTDKKSGVIEGQLSIF